MRPLSRKQAILFHIFLSVVLSAVLALYLSGRLACPLRRFAGIPCPLCGMSRSIFALLRGQFALSVQLHPMTIPLLTAVFLAVHARLLSKLRPYLYRGCAAVAALTLAVYFCRLWLEQIP